MASRKSAVVFTPLPPPHPHCSENIAQQKRLQGGLEKLHETAIQIDQLNVKLAVQKVVLEEKTTSCESLMGEINESTEVATAKKTQAQEKSVELGKQAKIIVAEKVSLTVGPRKYSWQSHIHVETRVTYFVHLCDFSKFS